MASFQNHFGERERYHTQRVYGGINNWAYRSSEKTVQSDLPGGQTLILILRLEIEKRASDGLIREEIG
jgi:hypothetical protein